MLLHDALILCLPLFFQFFEFGLADHLVKTGTKMSRDTARLADPFAYDAQNAGQILWPNDQQCHKDNKHQLRRSDVKHVRPPAARAELASLSTA